jgi:putative DNA primase/helicase
VIIESYRPNIVKLGFNLTDLGNAERLHHYFGQDLRYCEELGKYKWMLWNGARWVTGAVTNAAIKNRTTLVARIIDQEVALSDEREPLRKWAKHTESAGAEAGMLAKASSLAGIPITFQEIDARPHLLNTPNGTLDLATGIFREHRREDLLTQMTRARYVEDAQCPEWEKFLLEAADGRQELVDYLQRAAGRALDGRAPHREHKMLLLYGPGGNGKSTFYETLLHVLGGDDVNGYGHTIPVSTLLYTQNVNEGATPELFKLRGKRLVVAKEPEEGRRLSIGQLKQLVGGDTLTARQLYGDPVTFLPTWTLMLSTNNQLRIQETDEGTWQRIDEVPWDVTFRGIPGKDNPKLKEILQAEAEGILAWMVRGYQQWSSAGLSAPDCVKQQTEKYRESQDTLSQWFWSSYDIDPEGVERTTDLIQSYATYESLSVKPTSRMMSTKVEKLLTGYPEVERISNPYSGFKGIRRKPTTIRIDGKEIQV